MLAIVTRCISHDICLLAGLSPHGTGRDTSGTGRDTSVWSLS